MKKRCKKCNKIKCDTEFPIYIAPIINKPLGLYKYCQDCSPKRILHRMDKYFNNITL